MTTKPVLALVRDLMLRSRIEAAAAALGVEVVTASTVELARERAAAHAPGLIVADLSDANFPAEAVARDLRAAAAEARIVGFASHVDLKALGAARAAGFNLTLSRSEFVARLPELLKS